MRGAKRGDEERRVWPIFLPWHRCCETSAPFLTLRNDLSNATHFARHRFSACCPRFGRFRRDNFKSVEASLIGESTPDPILSPSVVTTPPPSLVTATSVIQSASLLRRICDNASLLLQQRTLVKNAAAIAAASCQHALTVTMPFPSLKPEECFYRKNEMRRETQVNLLTLLQRVCRIYQTATTLGQGSRGRVQKSMRG